MDTTLLYWRALETLQFADCPPAKKSVFFLPQAAIVAVLFLSSTLS